MNSDCPVCGHLKGDHEGPFDGGYWACDDDRCEDSLEDCFVPSWEAWPED